MRQRPTLLPRWVVCLVIAGCSASQTARDPDAAESSRGPDQLIEAIVYTTIRPPNFDIFLFDRPDTQPLLCDSFAALPQASGR